MSKILPNNAVDIIRQSGAGSLPDNPSQSGFNAKQIKAAIERPNTVITQWLSALEDKIDFDPASVKVVTTLPDSFTDYSDYTVFLHVTEANSVKDVTVYVLKDGSLTQIGDSIDTTAGLIDILQGYFTSGKANYAIRDGSNRNIVDTYATKTELGGEVTKFKDGTYTAKKAEKDADGNTITSTYSQMDRAENITAKKTYKTSPLFDCDITFDYQRNILMWDGFLRTTTNKFLQIGGDSVNKVIYEVPYYGNSFYGNTYTLSTTSQVATAKAEAISSAAATAQSKVDALATTMDFDVNSGSFGEIKADKMTVRVVVSEKTESVSSAIENHYFEFIKGNTTDLSSNYAGSVFTKYDSDYDFFYGMHGHEFVFGKCEADRDSDGNVTDIDDVSLIPAMGRAATSALTNDHVLKWDAAGKKAVDGGFTATEVMSVLGQENQRILNEQGRVAAENARNAIETTRERILPFPITNAEYNHIKNDGYYYNVYADGTYDVTQTADEDAVNSFAYQSQAFYPLIDDTTIATALATISEATELVNSIVFVTAEQWAEYYRLGTLDPDKHYVLDDEQHMKLLCVDIPAAEEERQAFETYRIEHEAYGITRAQLAMLNASGVFGVHFATVNDKLTTVVTVYASQALAEAAEEEYIFPMQQGVTYALLD